MELWSKWRLLTVAIALSYACGNSTTVAPTANVFAASDVASILNDGTKANISAIAKDAKGNAGSGTIVFTASYGDINGTGTPTATASLDSTGSAKVTYACSAAKDPKCVAGGVFVLANWSGVTGGVPVQVTTPGSTTGTGGGGGGTSDAGTTGGGVDAGTKVAGPPTTVIETGETPALLGLKGSGIQETGFMTFLVTDAAGIPAPAAAVTFSQAFPNLVTLSNTTATSDNNGNVIVSYSSGSEVGVSSIVATLNATGATASHPVAVRGAKPSASGFYFHCADANLPVYTTTNQYQSTECTVRLSDRFGNRVGIPTPVFFAAEAGSISASATTQAFDPTKPTDPNEGSVTVTFASDFGNGFMPVQTTPLLALGTQYPFARAAEPANGTFNPRDQLVTIIAMVRGEEAFVDTNHNGQYDPGEIFVDEGDPYIDSNDNNQYDGDTEVRFCESATCASYQGPNGVWDSNRTIWVPTWVVFSGPSRVTVTAPSPSCLDYSDNDVPNPSSTVVAVSFVDQWLNPPAASTTFAFNATILSPQTGLKLTTLQSSSPQLDEWGAMGVLHTSFDWIRVAGSDPVAGNTACTGANTTTGACVEKLVFYNWDLGQRLTGEIDNNNKTPTTPGHACGTASTGTHVAPYTIQANATENGIVSTGSTSGTFGY